MSIKPALVQYYPKLACIRKAHGQKFSPQVVIRHSDKESMDDLNLKPQDQFVIK